jgi:hypothetical protein
VKQLAVALILCVACSSESEPSSQLRPLVPRNFRQAGYSEVRACRAPGEHSALGAFTVWIDNDSRAAFDALWEDREAEMPAGAIVVKEIYAGTSCDEADALLWVVMRKEAGFDPDNGDWRWQEIDRDRRVTSDGSVATCIECHRGRSSCTGYGADNGKDYLCTMP